MYLTEKGNSISLTPRLIMLYEVLYVLTDPKGFCAMAHDCPVRIQFYYCYIQYCVLFVRKRFLISLYI